MAQEIKIKYSATKKSHDSLPNAKCSLYRIKMPKKSLEGWNLHTQKNLKAINNYFGDF